MKQEVYFCTRITQYSAGLQYTFLSSCFLQTLLSMQKECVNEILVKKEEHLQGGITIEIGTQAGPATHACENWVFPQS